MKKNEISSRFDVINKIGEKYRKHNIETDEFSYRKVLKKKTWSEEDKHYKLDLRFESVEEKLSIIVELKNEVRRFTDEMEKQLLAYRELEKQYRSKHKIISILYDLKNKHIKVWKDDEELIDEVTINSFEYYLDLYSKKINDKDKVLETTNDLNKLLHSYHIQEEQRSQFVGSLLVALNNGLEYMDAKRTETIIEEIKAILQGKIENDENKKIKTELLIEILDKQNIRELKYENLKELLLTLEKRLIPFINNKTAQGEDLLNLFFTTFNKYVGKKDKNQAYTPTHVTDFMCDIVDLKYNSRVLDPTCGSGAFLVQAMAKMLHKAHNDEDVKKNIKKNQLFGIEQEEKAFGLATTNMLIHDDGKSNIINASCFEKTNWIKEKNIDVVLMNPPFNGQKVPSDCPTDSKNTDQTKGFYFVKYVADTVGKGMLATILPLQCAIGTDSKVAQYKKLMLEKHTLKAVFSLPDDVFYPGAAVNVCVMLFELGVRHDPKENTFFGYYKEDGFVKKKNKGRVEKHNWENTKNKWLKAFKNKEVIPGFSVLKNVNYDDEWLAEAYMETDYSQLTENDFIQTIRDFIAFKVKSGDINE